MSEAAAPTFKRRQRVMIIPAMGPRREAASVVRPDRTWAGWWIVRYDDGNKACVHGTMLEVVA